MKASESNLAEELFAEYLLRREGEPALAFEAFCAEHPEQAEALRELQTQWDGVAREWEPLHETPAFGLRLKPENEQRYTVAGEIARGGMGAILRVKDESLGRPLAMKVVLPASGTKPEGRTRERCDRLLAEARITGQLDHPGVVPVHELSCDAEGRPFFTMQLVRGHDLGVIFDKVREQQDGWTRARALGVLLRVCETVAFAHDKGVIHRDLKPANIMAGRFGETYVMDWGLAKLVSVSPRSANAEEGSNSPTSDADSARIDLAQATSTLASSRPSTPQLTAEGSVMGTPAYMSPEQAKGSLDDLGPRSDVYAIGAMLYELLTGNAPFTDRHTQPLEIVRAVRTERPTAITTLAGTVPPELVAICEKAMANQPAARYGSALELAQDLQAWLDKRVVRAYQSSSLIRLKKWLLRNRGLASGIAAALVIAIGLTTAYVVQQVQFARQSAWESYVANLSAAEAALQIDDVAAARQYLEQIDAELRGWEWQHLYSRLDRSLAQLTGHRAAVRSVQYSPDQTRILSASWDHTLRLWDARSHELLRVYEGHRHYVLSADFNSDGTRIVSGSYDGSVRVWDTETGETIQVFGGLDARAGSTDPALSGHLGPVTSTVFSPDDRQVVSASYDRTIRVWDLDSNRAARVLEGHAGAVYSISFHPDGNRLASGSWDGSVRLWDLTAPVGQEALQAFTEHDADVWSVAFSPDGKLLASGSEDLTVIVRDWQQQQVLSRLRGHRRPIQTVSFAPDGARLATASWDGTLRLWDPLAEEELAVLSGHKGWAWTVAFSPDGRYLVSGSDDRSLRLWNADVRGTNIRVLEGHRKWVYSVSFSHDGKHLASGSLDATIREWDLETLDSEVMRGHRHRVSGVGYLPESRRLASLSEDGSLRIWNRATKKTEAEFAHDNHVDITKTAMLAHHPSRDVLAFGAADNLVRILDLADGSHRDLSGHQEAVLAVAIDPRAHRLASGSRGGEIRIWDFATGRLLHSLRRNAESIGALAFSADGQRLVSGSWDGTATLWDPVGGGELATLNGHTGWVITAAFQPIDGGARLATGSQDGTVRIWDGFDGREILTLHQHTNAVTGLAWSPDGQRLASASADRRVVLWELEPAP